MDRMRDEMQFDSSEALGNQLKKDAVEAKTILQRHA
jgi:FAD synthase